MTGILRKLVENRSFFKPITSEEIVIFMINHLLTVSSKYNTGIEKLFSRGD